jgi:hypothetical protein
LDWNLRLLLKGLSMRHLPLFRNFLGCLCGAFLLISVPASGAGQTGKVAAAPDRFLALPIAQGPGGSPRMLYRYGVPFLETAWHAPADGSMEVNVGAALKKIFLLGMTETQRPSAWSDPLSDASRYFIGDDLGRIRLHYADGSTQDFPLVLGESVWWGLPFYQTREPFPTDARLRAALAQALRLYPAAPTDDGNYVAVIVPGDSPIGSIEIDDSPQKHGSVKIAGITVEAAEGTSIAGATPIPAGVPDLDFARFLRQKPLRVAGVDESGSKLRLNQLSEALYTTDAVFQEPIAAEVPKDYSGPHVVFEGTNRATTLENAFYANVMDMLAKIDPDGTYHTSTRNALSWAGDPRSAGGEFGTYRKDVGIYYGQAWSRDLGRNLQELTELGYLNQASHVADFAFRSAQTWAENPSLTYKGSPLPPHWSRVIDHPDFAQPLENDGHGMIAIFIYKLWLRLPDRDSWLRAHWTGVKEAGDWIPWQFDHADITGAKDGVLYTTGESAGGKGYSVYADYVCMDALLALAQMADSIGETQSATEWRDRAEKMRKAMLARYAVTDPKYGRVWTLEDAGWPNRSTVLGPLIFLADYAGFTPQDDDPVWRSINEATYQRLIDTYQPLGFYGWAMGYGQGFVTQSALLLDRMKDATTMLNWMAREVYDPQIHSYVVPEGVQLDPTGRFIYRTGDQGNGVQEAEIVKTLRILVGVDDTQPERLLICPRMPFGWTRMAVDGFPALVEHDGKKELAHVHYDLRRTAGRMTLRISADRSLGPVAVRLGPFEKEPQASDVMVNGRRPAEPDIEKSGDSWWLRFNTSIGPAPDQAKDAAVSSKERN